MIGQNFEVMLRITAPGEDLPWVRDFLSSGPSSLVDELYEHEDEVAGLSFRNSPPFTTSDEKSRWATPAFRNLAEWLRSKTVEDFDKLRKAEISVDAAVIDYVGHVPRELLKELVRVGIDLYVLPEIVEIPREGSS